MSAITGSLIFTILAGASPPGVSPMLGQYSAPFGQPSIAVAPSIAGGTSSGTGAVTVAPLAALTGNQLGTFADEIFEKIIMIPRTKDLGVFNTEKSIPVEVWNSYRKAAKSMTSISISGGGGLSVANPYSSPTLFGPFQSRSFTAIEPVSGAASVSDTATFNFSGISGATLIVTGSREIVLSFAPNWRDGIGERLEWLGSAMDSLDGHEQRYRLIQNPRRVFTYPILPDTLQEMSLYQSIIQGRQTRPMTVPIWRDAQYLGVTLASGATVIPVVTIDRDFVAGQRVILWDDFQNFETGTIAAGGVASNQITLTFATARNWKASTQVIPCRTARVSQDQEFSRLSSRVTEAPLSIEIDPGNVPIIQTGYSYPYTYRGLPVFYEEHNWIDANSAKFTRDSETLDFGFGGITIIENSIFPTHIKPLSVLKTTRAEITTFMKFLGDRRGIDSPFWMPSGQAAIEIVGSIGASDVSFAIKDIGLDRLSAFNEGRRDIVFVRDQAGFPLVMRRITDAVTNGDGTETITIDSSLGFGATQASFIMVSWLEFCRLDSEAVSLVWHNQNTVSAQMQLRAIRSPD